MDGMQDLYQEQILAHSRQPRHYGTLPRPTHAACGENPLCGDRFEVQLELDAGGIVRAAAFSGSGCAISKASGSMLMERLIGRPQAGFADLLRAFEGTVRGDGEPSPGEEPSGPGAVFASLRQYPARIPCALLCWHAVRDALASAGQTEAKN